MALQPGDKLGPYEILAPLGAGGMGEVYKARDTRLNTLSRVSPGTSLNAGTPHTVSPHYAKNCHRN